MKITICGSIAFMKEMRDAEDELRAQGHEVKLPPPSVPDGSGGQIPVEDYYRIRKAAKDDDVWIWDRKAEAIRNHFDKVAWADAILVLNPEKGGVEGYIGSNTLLEVGLAFHLKKLIYLFNPIPELPCREELLAMRPVVLHGVFDQLKS